MQSPIFIDRDFDTFAFKQCYSIEKIPSLWRNLFNVKGFHGVMIKINKIEGFNATTR